MKKVFDLEQWIISNTKGAVPTYITAEAIRSGWPQMYDGKTLEEIHNMNGFEGITEESYVYDLWFIKVED